MPRNKPITIEQRRALREWHSRQYPRPSQKACQRWFKDKYNHSLSQSTVSESLSKHFDSVDNSSAISTAARLRTGTWPDLEEILFDWQKQIEDRGGNTSG